MPLSVSVSGSPVSLDLQPVIADAYGTGAGDRRADRRRHTGGRHRHGHSGPCGQRQRCSGDVDVEGRSRGVLTPALVRPLTSGRHLVEVAAVHAGANRATPGSFEVDEALPPSSQPRRGVRPKQNRPPDASYVPVEGRRRKALNLNRDGPSRRCRSGRGDTGMAAPQSSCSASPAYVHVSRPGRSCVS